MSPNAMPSAARAASLDGEVTSTFLSANVTKNPICHARLGLAFGYARRWYTCDVEGSAPV